MIDTMNKQIMHFVSETGEYGLLHETNPGQSFPILEVSFYDDYESSLPLESIFMDHTPLTGLELSLIHI